MSTDGGATWLTGNLPGITKIDNSANLYDRVSDPSLAFDARRSVWLISSLAIVETAGDINGGGRASVVEPSYGGHAAPDAAHRFTASWKSCWESGGVERGPGFHAHCTS
jgi:hypothetical protein